MIVGISTFAAKKKAQSLMFLHDFHENHAFIPPCNYQVAILNSFIENLSKDQKETDFHVELMPSFKEWIAKNRPHIQPTTTLSAILCAYDHDMKKGSINFVNFDHRSAIDFAMITIHTFCEQLRAYAVSHRLSVKRLFYGGGTFSEAVDAYCSRAKINNEWFPIMYEATVGNYLDQLGARKTKISEIIETLPISLKIKDLIENHYKEVNARVYQQLSMLLSDKKVDSETHLFYAIAILQDQCKFSKPEALFLTEAAHFADIELLVSVLQNQAERIVVHAGATHTGFITKVLLLLQDDYVSTSTPDGYIAQGLCGFMLYTILPQWVRYKTGLLKPYFQKMPHMMKKVDLLARPLSQEKMNWFLGI